MQYLVRTVAMGLKRGLSVEGGVLVTFERTGTQFPAPLASIKISFGFIDGGEFRGGHEVSGHPPM